ncbi:hypothetical protein [Moritella viscosa]|uniref:hypothetical protein n=1 Tax=Moritella viscosa TaxID=80854 RepID=UPI00091E54A9|nr:hypothetical protein [Moritella viscosa]SGY86114.1 Domain of unknown function (DUF334) [Moritella viscosa]
MPVTLTGFKWDDKQDIKWLTNYFSDAKRQPKSDISIPNIKRLRDGKSKEEFELFFDKLLSSNDHDKKLRKNLISAWSSKLKKLQNHKQVNIEVTSDAYERLIILKDLRGNKSTIKDTILDLIDDEYQIENDILMSLEDKIRKEITREMKSEIREKVIKEMENKASRQRKTHRIITPKNKQHDEENISTRQVNTENILMEKFDALAKDTNAKFEKLELMITALTDKDDSPIEERSLSVDVNSNSDDNQSSKLTSTEKTDNYIPVNHKLPQHKKSESQYKTINPTLTISDILATNEAMKLAVTAHPTFKNIINDFDPFNEKK